MQKIVNLESTMAEALVRNATIVGTNKFLEIPLTLLQVDPEYQRTPGSKVAKIAREWSDEKCNPPMVSFRGGEFFVMDGQNTVLAAKMIGKDALVCRLYVGYTQEDEARIFAGQNDNKTSMSAYDKYKAEIVYNDPRALALRRICEKHGVQISNVRALRKPRYLNSTSRAMKLIANQGEERLDVVFSLIEDLGWDEQIGGYSGTVLSCLAAIVGKYGYKKPVVEAMKDGMGWTHEDNWGPTVTASVARLQHRECRGAITAMTAMLEDAILRAADKYGLEVKEKRRVA